MLRVVLHLFIVGAVLGRPKPAEELTQKSASAIPENMSEEEMKDWTVFMKIIRDTSLTKEQRVDKVKQAMLGNETEAERKTVIEETELAIDFNDWIVKQVATAPVKVKEAFNKIYDMLCDINFLKMTPDERTKEIEQTLTTLNDDDKKELGELNKSTKDMAEQLGLDDLMMPEAKPMTASRK